MLTRRLTSEYGTPLGERNAAPRRSPRSSACVDCSRGHWCLGQGYQAQSELHVEGMYHGQPDPCNCVRCRENIARAVSLSTAGPMESRNHSVGSTFSSSSRSPPGVMVKALCRPPSTLMVVSNRFTNRSCAPGNDDRLTQAGRQLHGASLRHTFTTEPGPAPKGELHRTGRVIRLQHPAPAAL